MSVNDPSHGYLSHVLRKEEMNILVDAGVAAHTAEVREVFSQATSGDYKKDIEDGEIVDLIAKDVANQKATFVQGQEPGNEDRTTSTPGHKEKTLAAVDEVLRRFQERNKRVLEQDSSETGKNTENKIDAEENGIKSAQDVSSPSYRPASPYQPADVSITFHKEGVQHDTTQEKVRKLIEGVEKSSERIESLEKRLNERKEKAKESLTSLGLTKIGKGIEAFGNLSPTKKFAIGMVFAGASVATGGMTSILSKGLSSLSYASMYYKADKAHQEGNEEEFKKGRAALKALGLGIVTALATSSLLSSAGEYVSEHFGEEIASVKERVGEFFGNLFSEKVPETPVVAEQADLYGQESSPVAEQADLFGQEPPLVEPASLIESIPELPEYTVQPGDSITKIILQEVLPSIPGAEELTLHQKENMIQNMLQYAQSHPYDFDFETINKFANPDLIYPGDALDINKIRELMMSSSYERFGGETLIEHAKKM
jgi:hypothetical protein